MYRNTEIDAFIVNKAADLVQYLSDESDGLGMAYRLDAKAYVFGQDLTLAYPIVATGTSTKGTTLTATSPTVVLTYSGTGGFFRSNSTTPIAALVIDHIELYFGAGADLFDIDESENIQITFATSRGVGGLGTVKNAPALVLDNAGLVSFSSGITFENVGIQYTRALTMATGAIGGAYIAIKGTFTAGAYTDIQAVPLSGDSVFDIDSGISAGARIQMLAVNKIAAAPGTFFKSGGLTQTDPRISINNCPGSPNSQTIGSLYMERNTTDTVITAAGVTADITAFADAGGGKTIVSTGTTPTDGTTVWIINDSYTGKYVTSNTILNTSYEIVKAYTGTDTGSWENGWVKVVGTTYPMENERASMTDDNEITMTNLEQQAVTVMCSTNPENDGIAATKDWEFAVMKNGERLKGSLKERQMTNKAGEGFPLCTTSAIAGDVFEVYVRGMSDGTDMIMRNMSLIINKVG
ncbi:MAG: hypothetical protein ACTSW1_08225 [Candidatus Hodarchaeales archaeon]